MAGGEDCLWYVDRNGSWHPGFDCEAFSFCCGSCHQRYCCYDPLRLLTERQQRHCLAFRCPGLHAAGAGSHCWVLGVAWCFSSCCPIAREVAWILICLWSKTGKILMNWKNNLILQREMQLRFAGT